MRRRPSALSTVVLALLTGLALAACSTGPSGGAEPVAATAVGATAADPNAFPVTIRHAFGETTIGAQPQRVVTLGWSDQDVVAALGVVPVGAVKITWGGNAAGSTPWFDARVAELEGAAPTRYSDADGAPVDEIARLAPDLILATNSGVTREEYASLSKLAPVVANPGAPWVTPWQTSVELVGQALGRSAAAATAVADTKAAIAAAGAAHPAIIGRSFIFASLATADMSKVDFYMAEDNRPRLLVELGLVNAPIVERLSRKGTFYGTISAEKAAELASDVFITYTETPQDLATFTKNPLLGQIPALRSGHVLASSNQTDALGLSAPSPLSIPYAMTHFVPELARAVAGRA